MIQTPAELYAKLISDFHLSEHVLCDLHKPCKKQDSRRCTSVLAYRIIDFDEVKTEVHRGKSGSPKSSVDGFTYKNQLYCFVELKGWADFLTYHTNPMTLETDIKEQAGKYDLNKKLIESLSICEEVSGNAEIFKDANIAFILVTDIDVDEDGTMEFFSDLMELAETSSDWEVVCNRELKDKLLSLPSNISTYYIKCQKFDEMISKL